MQEGECWSGPKCGIGAQAVRRMPLHMRCRLLLLRHMSSGQHCSCVHSTHVPHTHLRLLGHGTMETECSMTFSVVAGVSGAVCPSLMRVRKASHMRRRSPLLCNHQHRRISTRAHRIACQLKLDRRRAAWHGAALVCQNVYRCELRSCTMTFAHCLHGASS